jgi:hypothetical protein
MVIDQTTKNQDEDEDVFADTKTELMNRFSLLSPELKAVITSSDYQMKLFDLAKKYKLTYDLLGKMEVETTMVLIGMTPTAEYKDDLREQLGISDATLDQLVGDINTQIFGPIRTKLMELYPDEGGVAEDIRSRSSGTPSTKIYTPAQAPIQPQQQFLEKNENTVLQNSGIEVVEDTPTAARVEDPKLMEREMSAGIMNPPKSTSISLNQIRAQAAAPTKAPVQAPKPAPRPMTAAPVAPVMPQKPVPTPTGLPLDIPIPVSPKMTAMPKAPVAPAPSMDVPIAPKPAPVAQPAPAPMSGDPYREPIN